MIRKLKTFTGVWVVASLVSLFSISVVFGGMYAYTRFTEDTYTVTVTDKYPKDQKYLVFTDQGTFEVTDTFMYLRFNSSDVWGSIEKGTKYQITATGFRLGFFSMYENIIDFKKD